MELKKKIDIPLLIVGLCLLSALLSAIIPFKSWFSIPIGLMLGSSSGIAACLLIRQWEKSCKKNLEAIPAFIQPQPLSAISAQPLEPRIQELEQTLEAVQQQHREAIEELNNKNELLRKKDTEAVQFENRMSDLHHEFESEKNKTEEELRRKAVLLNEYQETINQQREVITKKQEQISELESKVEDLSYEVKTLLQLAEFNTKNTDVEEQNIASSKDISIEREAEHEEEPSSQVHTKNTLIRTSEQASFLLKRCIDMAQKMTGASHFANANSRFKEIPIDNRALDLRRLFDHLQSETSAMLFVYSQKENKLLFINEAVMQLLGWTSEKFIHYFPDIIAESWQEWNKGISMISTTSESKIRLVMKGKSSQSLLVHCHLGPIPTGTFRHHLIGVLYPA